MGYAAISDASKSAKRRRCDRIREVEMLLKPLANEVAASSLAGRSLKITSKYLNQPVRIKVLSQSDIHLVNS